MIGRLRGVLVEKHPPRLVVDCHGVGYELEAPMTTIWSLPDLHQEVLLYTHLIVREDAHLLFGFGTVAERRLFQSLLKISGVGAKVALAILSGIQVDEFVVCVQQGNTARLTTLPGVGKKTAERLIVEMRDRVADWNDGTPFTPAAAAGTAAPDAVTDAISGLIALGYKPQDASRFVHAVETAGKPSEQIIREVLKGLVRG